jgi:hypothetical protein
MVTMIPSDFPIPKPLVAALHTEAIKILTRKHAKIISEDMAETHFKELEENYMNAISTLYDFYALFDPQ